MWKDSKQEKDNLKNALCYLPIVPIVFAFTERQKTDEFKKHMYRGIVIFVAYMFFYMFWTMVFWARALYFRGIIALVYFIAIGILWYNAYRWEDFEVLNDFEEKVKDNIK